MICAPSEAIVAPSEAIVAPSEATHRQNVDTEGTGNPSKDGSVGASEENAYRGSRGGGQQRTDRLRERTSQTVSGKLPPLFLEVSQPIDALKKDSRRSCKRAKRMKEVSVSRPQRRAANNARFDGEDDGHEDQVDGEEGVNADRDGIGELLCLRTVAKREDDLETEEDEV
jgi:hypothetical protein